MKWPKRNLFRAISTLSFSPFAFRFPILLRCFISKSEGGWWEEGGWRGIVVQEGRRFVNNRLIVRCSAEQSESVLEGMILSKNAQNAVVVYSKSWCPYCARVKSLFKELGVEFLLVELNEIVEEQEVQDALRRLTGQSTVPSIFIGGKHIGGCDNTMDLHKRGELLPLLTAAGATVSNA
ncbi:hypothetical protein R1flu_003640 [Riccia fluitans]|uniref:Glutaredoxin domain-containing protein n=1 Tax=Riccia fluitans TaxID=41844 RepID=A0ABD1YA73_9MARC